MTTALCIFVLLVGPLAIWIAASRYGYLRGFNDGYRQANDEFYRANEQEFNLSSYAEDC